MDSPKKVLIIDDDETFASTLVDAFNLAGIHSLTLTARDALKEFEEGKKYCCILLDFQMPDLDGNAFICAFAKIPNIDKPPLILVSGFIQSEINNSAELARSLGFKSVRDIHKPFKFSEVITEVRQLVGIPALYDMTSIEKGFRNGEFKQVYQPIIDLKHNRCIGVEALTRWSSPKSGAPIAPNLFIPAIEASSILEDFTLWTVEKAAQQWKDWSENHLQLKIAVNFAANSLDIPKMSEACKKIVLDHDMPMSELIIEVTETATFDHPQTACESLHHFRGNNARLAVDDFGTGYSSLKQLMQLPYSEVKIDQCFTSEILNDPAAEAIVKAIISLSHSLGYKVIAEGVETPEIDLKLKELGVDYAQGYFYSRPVNSKEILDFMGDFIVGLEPFQTDEKRKSIPLRTGALT